MNEALTPAEVFNRRTFEGDDLEFFHLTLRVQSFKIAGRLTWPFMEDCNCTPQKMAEAGFYFVGTENEPDLARCYWCRRELDGWEPLDEPWKEHERRPCPFIKLKKKQCDLKMNDVIKLEKDKLIKLVGKVQERESAVLEEKIETLKEKITAIKTKPKRRRK